MKQPVYNVLSSQLTGTVAVTAGTQWATQLGFATSAASLFADDPDGITIAEEVELRENNTFVKELYDEYRVALILAHGED